MSHCKVQDCESKARSNGLCHKHLSRLRFTGTTDPGPKAHASIGQRLQRFFVRGEPSECWFWLGETNPAGYGLISAGAKKQGRKLAHRVSWESANGAPAPTGMVVMHTCDTPACVNPAHLKLGSQVDNMLDMLAKKRGHKPPMHFGEKQHSSKLTEQIVREIRNSTETTRALSDRYGVNVSSIQKARRRITWKHLE